MVGNAHPTKAHDMTLRNLGLSSMHMLASVGIETEQQLREMGAVAAYVAVQRAGFKPSLNLLWAIEGALSNRHWQDVARDDRLDLLLALDHFLKDTHDHH